MDLFLDDPKGLPKIAAAMSRLSENPDDWQSEIINELLRQAPYVGDFEPKLIMNELDPERRYALGGIELRSRQAVNPRDDRVPPEIQGVKQVLVPVIVNDGKMYPLDVFVHNGECQPLTESRLRRAMFRPQLFEAISKRPGDHDIMSTLYPPYRSGGFGLGGNSFVGTHEMGKTGSAKPDLIDQIHNTIRQSDIEKMAGELRADPTLCAAVMGNKATLSFMEKISRDQNSRTPESMIKQAACCIRPKVVQIKKTSSGFLIKTANPDTLLPEENKIDRPTAEETVGSDIVKQVERDGTVTVSTDPVVKDSLADLQIKRADEFGEWKVKTNDGKELIGWVFPRCVDLDGTNTALSIFSNGSQSALQENIAGSLVGKGSNLIDEDPTGFGCFYLARAGSAQAIIPMTIKAESRDPDGTKMYMADTIMGDSAEIRMLPGLNRISRIGDSKYCIPDDCGWMPMREMTSLAEDADQFTKTAAALRTMNQVEIMTDGCTYSMKGQGIEKLAKVLPVNFIDYDQAVYNLSILGVHPSFCKEKLAETHASSRWVEIDGVRPITLASEKYHQAKTAAAKFISRIPDVKSLMLKEAATLDDPLSVDKVLSIGFLNPENISVFISYLPEFEHTLQKLSELLVASRLGLQTVDTGSLERIVKHLDKVIGGLREMSQHPQA